MSNSAPRATGTGSIGAAPQARRHGPTTQKRASGPDRRGGHRNSSDHHPPRDAPRTAETNRSGRITSDDALLEANRLAGGEESHRGDPYKASSRISGPEDPFSRHQRLGWSRTGWSELFVPFAWGTTRGLGSWNVRVIACSARADDSGDVAKIREAGRRPGCQASRSVFRSFDRLHARPLARRGRGLKLGLARTSLRRAFMDSTHHGVHLTHRMCLV